MVLLQKILDTLPVPYSRQHSVDRTTTKIRKAMLALLQPYYGRQRVQQVTQRIRFADDLEALWYLRQDLVTLLSDFDGEGLARHRIHPINRMFRGYLPSALEPRRHQHFDS